MIMRIDRIHVLGLISIMALVLSSCGGPAKQVDALITETGKQAGIVIEYKSPIDKGSVSNESFQVPGKEIRTCFVSNSNTFRKISGEQLSGGGRFVIIILDTRGNSGQDAPVELTRGNEIPKYDVRVKQVSPVTTISGKVIKPWKKALKATEYFGVDNSFIR